MSLSILNKHAPSKIKLVRGNQMPFYDKEISSELRQELITQEFPVKYDSGKEKAFRLLCLSFKKDQKEIL